MIWTQDGCFGCYDIGARAKKVLYMVIPGLDGLICRGLKCLNLLALIRARF